MGGRIQARRLKIFLAPRHDLTRRPLQTPLSITLHSFTLHTLLSLRVSLSPCLSSLHYRTGVADVYNELVLRCRINIHITAMIWIGVVCAFLLCHQTYPQYFVQWSQEPYADCCALGIEEFLLSRSIQGTHAWHGRCGSMPATAGQQPYQQGCAACGCMCPANAHYSRCGHHQGHL
jgi:hypothetical protein